MSASWSGSLYEHLPEGLAGGLFESLSESLSGN